MNPLMVTGGVGELVDPRLGERVPAAHAEALPRVLARFVYGELAASILQWPVD